MRLKSLYFHKTKIGQLKANGGSEQFNYKFLKIFSTYKT